MCGTCECGITAAIILSYMAQLTLIQADYPSSLTYTHELFKKQSFGASLVAQWLRICLPMQGTQVRALVWEDPTCHGATRPVSHNY